MAKKAVIGLVASEAQAENIVIALQRLGFSSNDISVLLQDQQATRNFAQEQHTKAPSEGAVAAVSAGGAVGGTLGFLAGIGALAIPGVGPLIAAGPILATLSGAAAGAAMVSLAGALVGMGMPESEAKQYEGKIKDGHVLVSIHIHDARQRDQAKRIVAAAGAIDVVITGEHSPHNGHAPVVSRF